MNGSPPLEPTAADAQRAGDSMLRLVHELFPLCRSITGPGLRATLAGIADRIPLQLTEVPTGSTVFDWTVPREWAIDDAWLEHETGRRFAEFAANNLHVVGYSVPVDEWLDLDALRPRLHTLPQHPDWVPFRSTYYKEDWGFCLADRVARELPPGRYRAVIRSRLYDGALTLGEHVHRGESPDEILIFAHTCHPSLANDNLSGIAVATELAAWLDRRRTRYTYRFLFAPATIGSIAWMARNPEAVDRTRHGLVLAMLGDDRPLQYGRTINGQAPVDRAAAAVLPRLDSSALLHDFLPWGFDERQFNTPGVRMAVGRLTRSMSGQYPQEHTSADNPSMISAEALAGAWQAAVGIVHALDSDRRWMNLMPNGEPQLGRRGLYRQSGGYYDHVPERHLALLWMLQLSDGRHSLLDIAERSQLPIGLLQSCARDLERARLLAIADDDNA